MRGSAGTKTYLQQNSVVTMTNRAILELNMNRYATISPVSDSVYGGRPEYYKEKFPLESVVRPVRPTSGIVRPRFGSYTTKWQSSTWLNSMDLCATYDGTNDWYTIKPRHYYSGPTDAYKYFTANVKMPTPEISYTADIWCNHVVIGFENTFDWPTTYTIQAKISSVWTTIATSPSISTDGQVKVYRVAGSWTLTEPASPSLSDAIKIGGLRVVPTVMNRPGAYLAIIEMSPRVQADVTQYLQSWSVGENISEDDALTPVGTVSANDGSVLFSNTGQDFEPRLAGQPTIRLGDISKKYARVIIKTTINSEDIQVADMFCDDWVITEGDTAEAPLLDPAIVPQTIDCPEMVLHSVTPTAAIIRVLDSIGINKVRVRRLATETEPKIDWFYTTKDTTAWEAIQSVCRSHQYAVYYDEQGYLNIATKNWLFSRTTSQWTFFGQASGGNKPDIIDHSESTERPINKAVAKFVPTGLSRSVDPAASAAYADKTTFAFNRDATRILWAPERGILLGCAPLWSVMNSSQTFMRISPNALAANSTASLIGWGNFSGYLYVDQEIMKYDGLEFSYMTAGGPVTKSIKSSTELSELYAEAIGKVQFTGNITGLTRGMFGTTAAAHGFAKTSFAYATTADKMISIQSSGGIDGVLMNNTGTNTSTYISAYLDAGAAYSTYEVRMKLSPGPYSRAGMFISGTKNGSNILTSAYHISIRATEKGAGLELGIGRIGGTPVAVTKFFEGTIKEDVWYTMKVQVAMNSGGLDKIAVFGSGFSATASFPANKIPYTNGIGLIAWGGTKVFYDYIAAASGSKIVSDEALQAEALSNVLRGSSGKFSTVPYYFQSFTDFVREIYIEDVRFSKGPALNIDWYPGVNFVANNSITEGNAASRTEVAGGLSNVSPWGARVAVANIGRRPVILDSSDSVLFPQIFGQIVEELQEIEVTSKNEGSIIKFGENKLEIDSKWLTNRAVAQALLDWLVTTMSAGREIHEINCFANPLIEIGDVVTIDYTKKGLTTASKYVVQQVSRSWSEGMETSVRLVKV